MNRFRVNVIYSNIQYFNSAIPCCKVSKRSTFSFMGIYIHLVERCCDEWIHWRAVKPSTMMRNLVTIMKQKYTPLSRLAEWLISGFKRIV